jgi:hypothetical protein
MRLIVSRWMNHRTAQAVSEILKRADNHIPRRVLMRKATFIIAAVFLLLLAAALHADITIKQSITSKGLVGLTNMEGTQSQMISGDKAKTVSNIKLTSKVMKFLGAGKPQETAEITRLDKELFWQINLKDKEYKELTFAEVRAEMEKALKESEKEKAKYKKEHPDDSLQMRTEVKVDRTGKTQKIAGYTAKQVIITMIMYAKNSESGEAGAMTLTMDLWMSEDVPGAGDFQQFYSQLATKLGFTGHGQQSMEGMLAAFGVDPREIYKATKDLKGMSLMSTVSIGSMGQSGEKAEAKEQKKEKESDQAEEGEKGGVSKKLGGLFGKKNKESKEDKSGESQQSGPSYLMQFTTTVTEISATGIAASEFEVPAGFKLKK